MDTDTPVEIEVKFYLSDTESVREDILAMGAHASGRVFEINIRFEDEKKTFKGRGILLRLRKDNGIRLTFKAPPPVQDKDFKIHQELEVQVDDFHVCQRILDGLGFHAEQTYEKWRETFTLGETKLLVDAMPYGTFLEIEGDKSEIRRIADQLGFRWEERILLNYLEIFESIRRREDLPFYDITFDNFEKRPTDIRRHLSSLYAG
jgi:adenylate cyclase class 2